MGFSVTLQQQQKSIDHLINDVVSLHEIQAVKLETVFNLLLSIQSPAFLALVGLC